MPQHVAKGIAQGELDPFTKEAIQRESGHAEMVLNGTYQLKNFKAEAERKKLDLPAQKNLLTNYFCFASLEAKSKFRAPRVAPKQQNAGNEISNPDLDVHIDSGCVDTDVPEFAEALDHVGLRNREVADDTQMQQNNLLQNSVCKPCVSFHRGRGSDQGNGKMISGTKDGIVRSSYFQHKFTMENNKENKISIDESDSNKFENICSDHVFTSVLESSEVKCRKENKEVIVRSSYFQNMTIESANFNRENESVKKNLVPLHLFGYDADKCKSKIANRSGRVQSSYFQRNSVDVHNQNTTSEDPAIRINVPNEMCEHAIPGSDSNDDSGEGTMKKRKVAYSEIQTEEVSGSNPTTGRASNLEEEKKMEDGNFGCNISHLGHYSHIAEKSMEKFVSVISSFSFNSTGSRASGLRAPLKDIKNTCTKRSSTCDVDLSKFAYAPTKQKAPSKYRRS